MSDDTKLPLTPAQKRTLDLILEADEVYTKVVSENPRLSFPINNRMDLVLKIAKLIKANQHPSDKR